MSTRRSRRGSTKKEQSWLTNTTLLIVGAVLGAIVIGAFVVDRVGGGNDTPEVLEGAVQELPDEGRDHVPDGTEVDYDTDPPASGPHYSRWAPPDLYREQVPYEMLVHNLEHGHVVIYYSPSLLSDDAASKISDLVDEYDGQWDAVLAVPREDPENELILTAWTYKLELDRYDEEMVDAFVDAYRGKGPENPVR